MATIRQLSNGNAESTIILDQFERWAPVFNDIDAYSRGGNSDSLKKARDGKGAASIFREINNQTLRNKTTIGDLPITKKIVSGDAQIDKVYEQRNIDIISELELQTRLESKEDAKVFHEKVWTGDSAADSKEFDGIFALTPAARTLTLAEADVLVLPLGGDAKKQAQQRFFEQFIMLQAKMPYQEFLCYMKESFTLRLVTAAKNLGYYSEVNTPVGKADKIGKAIIKSYGYKADGTELDPGLAAIGNYANPSGMTFVKWGEAQDLTFLTSAGMVGEYVGLVNEKFYTNTWDLDGNFGLQNDNALYQVNGISLEEAAAP